MKKKHVQTAYSLRPTPWTALPGETIMWMRGGGRNVQLHDTIAVEEFLTNLTLL